MKIFWNNKNYDCDISDEILISKATKILNNFGWFQIHSLTFLSFGSFALGLSISCFVFLNIVPPYKCQENTQNMLEKNISQLLKTNKTHQNSYTADSRCFRFMKISNKSDKIQENQTFLNLTLKKETCEGELEFDIENGNTLVSQFSLVCESGWLRPFVTASLIFGMFMGTIIGGRLADNFGRRQTSIIVFSVYTILTFSISFVPYFSVYLFLSFILGAMGILAYTSIYTWSLEIASSPAKRVLAAFVISAGYSFGGMSTSLIAYLAPDWNWIFIIKGFIFLFCLVFLWFVWESPSWLLEKQKYDDIAKVLRCIVETNKLKNHWGGNCFELKILQQEMPVQEKADTKNVNTKILLKNKVLRRRLILSCLLWNVAILSFYTNSFNAANLGGNAYLNNAVGNALEIVSLATTTFALKKCGRKTTLITALLLFGCVFIATPTAKQKNAVVGICLAMIGRFFGISVMMISILFSGEIFPTMLRNTSMCIASASSRLFGILSPFLIYVGEEIDLSIPFYVMGGIAFASVNVVLLLPETSSSSLLNTLEDALALKDPRYLQPCGNSSENAKNLKPSKSISDADVSV